MEPEGYTPIYSHSFWPATTTRRPTTNNAVYFDLDYLASLLKEAISQKRRQLKALQKELADLERELREIT